MNARGDGVIYVDDSERLLPTRTLWPDACVVTGYNGLRYERSVEAGVSYQRQISRDGKAVGPWRLLTGELP